MPDTTAIFQRRQKGIRFASVFICFLVVGVDVVSLADPAKAPKRSVNNLPVDLTPLFAWWTNQSGARPLRAWVHVTGSIVGTNSGAWVIEGKLDRLETSQTPKSTDTLPEPRRILLRNAPIEDLAEFERLRSRIAELNKQRAGLVDDQNQTKAQDEAVNEQQRASRRNRARARALAAEDKRLKQAETQSKNEQKPIDEELKELKAKLATYPKPDQYVVDCFALDLHYDSGTGPVYDHGRALNSPYP